MSVFAWRTWNLNSDGLLVATAAGVPWEPGINEAECRKTMMGGFVPRTLTPHVAPANSCSCGYWAFKTPARLLREFGGGVCACGCGAKAYGNKALPRVYGVVELAGQMIELELGYKAQFARIVALAAPEGMDVSPSYALPVERDLGQLFRTWWDGIQPVVSGWAEPTSASGYAHGGLIQPNWMQVNPGAMTWYTLPVTLTCSEPDQEEDSEPVKAENPAAERALKVRAKNDRPKWQSTYGPGRKR